MGQFTPDGFLAGEGHPLKGVSPKGCRPVDMGYNVEESLPSLALYSLLADDKPVQEQVVAAMKTHMEFMLPDGAWDNSFGIAELQVELVGQPHERWLPSGLC